jgi:antitoxin CcdA
MRKDDAMPLLTKPRTASSTPRRPTNVSLDRALVEEARAMGVNLSQACENGIAAQLARLRRERWLAENAAALESSNAHVDERGLPLAGYRQF